MIDKSPLVTIVETIAFGITLSHYSGTIAFGMTLSHYGGNYSFRDDKTSTLLMIMWNDDEKVNPLMFSEI